MKKLKDTTKNRALLFMGLVVGLSALGGLMARKGDKKIFMIVGAVTALFITPGISSWAIEKPKN